MGDGDEAGVAIGQAGGFWKATVGKFFAGAVIKLLEPVEFAGVGLE